MKILITGFEEFGEEAFNPSWEAIKRLPDEVMKCQIIKSQIPTSFNRSWEVVEHAMELHRPDIILCVGLAGGRPAITPEKVAINLAEARIPDNDGDQPIDQVIRPDGETAYFTNLPIKAMVKKMRDAGIQADVSYTAGTFVCNAIMYHVLHTVYQSETTMKAGFIHVPYATEQLEDKPRGTPAMSLDSISHGLLLALEAAIAQEDAMEFESGTIS